MPELPEVETVVRRLAEILPGKKIVAMEVLRDKSFSGDQTVVIGMEISDVSRRAKMIRIHGSDESQNLLIHLKMTGQVIYRDNNFQLDGSSDQSAKKQIGGGHPSADWVRDLPSSHTRVMFDFNDGSKMFFNDMRVFGWVRQMDNSQIQEQYDRYAPDINTDGINLNYLQKKLSKKIVPIKQAVLDNKVMAGVGNIYACEALHLSKIHPTRPSKSLSKKELKILIKDLKKVIDEGIKAGGTTFDGKYVGVDGLAGDYQTKLKVYGRQNKSCSFCEKPIQKIKLGGRGTYFCENCQV